MRNHSIDSYQSDFPPSPPVHADGPVYDPCPRRTDEHHRDPVDPLADHSSKTLHVYVALYADGETAFPALPPPSPSTHPPLVLESGKIGLPSPFVWSLKLRGIYKVQSGKVDRWWTCIVEVVVVGQTSHGTWSHVFLLWPIYQVYQDQLRYSVVERLIDRHYHYHHPEPTQWTPHPRTKNLRP
jgi:hypothetical protein